MIECVHLCVIEGSAQGAGNVMLPGSDPKVCLFLHVFMHAYV